MIEPAGPLPLLINWLVIGVTPSLLASEPPDGGMIVLGERIITGRCGGVVGGASAIVTGDGGVVAAPLVTNPVDLVVTAGLLPPDPFTVAAAVGPARDGEPLPVSAII